MFDKTPEYPPLPPDDSQRNLTIAQPDTDQTLPRVHSCRSAFKS